MSTFGTVGIVIRAGVMATRLSGAVCKAWEVVRADGFLPDAQVRQAA